MDTIINLKDRCNCFNTYRSDEEILDGTYNDCVVTFKETCKDCGSVTYGWEITDRDGEWLDGCSGYETREEAAHSAFNSDSGPY